MDPKRNDEKPAGTPAVPSPSASIILVSPNNRILLTHRVRTSSAFPSAHVFPGGNLTSSDGPLPTTGVSRHTDSIAYRTGAIRELFEETGILLACDRSSASPSSLIEISAGTRLSGRHAIHSGKAQFSTWLSQQRASAQLDTAGLIPFTHWITPPNVPKRFSTQMYVYFVPVGEAGNASVEATSDESENTAAEWKTASAWIEMSRRGEIILFPPQFLLLYLASRHLDHADDGDSVPAEEITRRRQALGRFVEEDSSPPWKDKYISPLSLGHDLMSDGRTVLSLEKPGLELKESGLRGETDMVVFVKFRKEGPRQVEVGWRKEVLEDARRKKEKEKDGSRL